KSWSCGALIAATAGAEAIDPPRSSDGLHPPASVQLAPWIVSSAVRTKTSNSGPASPMAAGAFPATGARSLGGSSYVNDCGSVAEDPSGQSTVRSTVPID